MVEEVSDRPVYTVTAELGEGRHRWVLQCEEIPGAISEVTRLDQAEDSIREAIAWVAEIDEDSFDVRVLPDLPSLVERRISAARDARQQEAQARRRAATEWRAAVSELGELGLPMHFGQRAL